MTTNRKMPKGVEVTDSGALRIWFMWRGKRVREPVGLPFSPINVKVAERLRIKVVAAIDRGAFTFTEFFPESKMVEHDPDGKTFEQIADLWFRSKVQEGIKATTKVKYRQLINQFWKPRYGNLPIGRIKASQVKLDIMEDEVLAEATSVRYNDALIPLRGVFDLAVELDLLESNPAAKIKNRTRAPADPDPFETGEVKAILQASFKLWGWEMADYFTVAFLTGLRPSEQIALLKVDAEMDRDRLLVCRSMNVGQLETPKTKAGRRYIELVGPAREALQRRLDTPNTKTHLFHHPNLHRPFAGARTVREAYWQPAVEEAGVRQRTMYTTRHTFATQALMAGAHPMWVANQMGHEDTKLVFSTYAKWLPDQAVNRESKKVEAALGSLYSVQSVSKISSESSQIVDL